MKKLLLLFLALCLVLPLSSCHGRLAEDGAKKELLSIDDISYKIPESFDVDKTYEITFWAKNDSNIEQANVYKKAISDFEALYPNVKVKLKLYTDYGRIYNDVITNISTSTTPNVCITYPDHIATYMTGEDTVVPLDGLFADEKYGLGGSELRFDGPTIDEIIPKFLEECSFDGYHYALPYMRSTEACYVNKTYVEALGYTLPEVLTWDFIWEVSEAALAKNSDGTYKLNGGDVMIPFIYKSSDNMMIQMTSQLDSGYSNHDGDVFIFNDTTKELLLEIGEHAKTRAFSTFKISSYPANFLNRGQCIFAIDSTAGASWMGTDAPNIDIPKSELVEFETVVMTVPQFDTENTKMISQGPSVCIFNKEDNGEVLASWLFVQFLLTNDIQLSYAETEGYIPVTLKALECDEYKDYLSRSGEDNAKYYSIKIDASRLFIANIENTFVTPVFNGSASLRDAAGQMIEEVTKGARRGKEINEEFIDGLYKDMISLYHLQADVSSEADPSADKLPTESSALLITMCVIWILIGAYFIADKAKNRQKNRNNP